MTDELREHTELWKQITARQTTPGSPHHDTEAIFLRWCESQTVHAAFTDLAAVDYPARSSLPACSRMIDELSSVLGVVELGRVMVVNLLPGGHIDPHIDEGAYADHYQRFHLSMTSEGGNHFRCGDEHMHMRPGEVWWFDHKQTHEVWNRSDSGRIHLILDAVLK